MFLPTTPNETGRLGWDELDIILITGDAYIDSPFIGVSVIGKVLTNAGFRVGVIAQPNVNDGEDVTRLGEPRLFWGVSGGAIDSLVANYTALKKKRKSDDYTPGGINNRRPDRAVIAYSNLIRRHFKDTTPIVLGGIEASLRRVAHYDYWSDKIRKSVLFDAKADYLIYGMAERTTLEVAKRLKAGKSVTGIPGLCYIATDVPSDYEKLPSFAQVVRDKKSFIRMFKKFHDNCDPITARGLVQKTDTRYLVQNPPAGYLSSKELDAIHDLDYERDLHPYYQGQGKVRALDTIKFSIATHRGCYGDCNFCSIGVHEGRTVRWRSEKSILSEARKLTRYSDFKGYIHDVGGPTANMYGYECKLKLKKGMCQDKRCTFPRVCRGVNPDHSKQTKLLQDLRKIKGIKKVFVSSGIRYDLMLADKRAGRPYLKEVVKHHVSGQMKVAPEHVQDSVLDKMGKPGQGQLLEFCNMFNDLSRSYKKKQFLTYYLIAAHPGCTENDMKELKKFASKTLKIQPEQVQIFTPLPSTYSALMYYTEMDPFTGKKLFVEKKLSRKERQKSIVVKKARPRR